MLVFNGDVPLVRRETVQALAALHERRRATATLLCCTMDAASVQQIGRLQRGARGKPIGVLETEDAPMPRKGEVEVNVGVYAFEARWLRRALAELKPRPGGEYYLTDLVPHAVADGRRVEAYVTQDKDEALSVNTRQDLARVEAAAQHRLRDSAMTAGATLVDPATVYLDADRPVGKGRYRAPEHVHPGRVESGARRDGWSERATAGRRRRARGVCWVCGGGGFGAGTARQCGAVLPHPSGVSTGGVRVRRLAR